MAAEPSATRALRSLDPEHLGTEPTIEDELVAARLAARQSEDELNEALAGLGKSIREPLSISRQVRANPTAWLAGAFAVGILLGLAGRRK